MGRIDWLPEEYDKLLAIADENPGASYNQLAQKLTDQCNRMFTGIAVKSKLNRHGLSKATLTFEGRKNEKEQDPETFLESVINWQEQLQDLDDRQTFVTAKPPDTKPIGMPLPVIGT